MTAVIALLALVIAVTAITYIWRSMSGTPTVRNRQPGAVLDSESEVRRVDLGMHTYVAQQAHAELAEDGVTTRVVELEEGAIGIALGMHYFLVYNAEDEPKVLAVVDRLLEDVE